MPRSRLRTVTLAAFVSIGAAACRRPAPPAPAPVLAEEYCWWAAFRTPLPPDTVAARYATAYLAAGFTGLRRLRRGDTVTVAAGPTPTPSRGDADTLFVPVAVRLVAFRRGDSTLFRSYVSAPAAIGGDVRIPLCGRLGAAARLGATAPREPGADERRAVWGTTP